MVTHEGTVKQKALTAATERQAALFARNSAESAHVDAVLAADNNPAALAGLLADATAASDSATAASGLANTAAREAGDAQALLTTSKNDLSAAVALALTAKQAA